MARIAEMKIEAPLLQEIVRHAVDDAPNECCGVVAARAGDTPEAVAVYRATNTAASPLRFEIDAQEVLALIEEIDQRGLELGAIYHSHTRTAPYPSQTDINFAANWPGVEWIIVGLDGGEPEVRSYLIDGATVAEVTLSGGPQ
jgi:[CysO sulfur-carrier protein]-S-L-cysteine hydrolase